MDWLIIDGTVSRSPRYNPSPCINKQGFSSIISSVEQHSTQPSGTRNRKAQTFLQRQSSVCVWVAECFWSLDCVSILSLFLMIIEKVPSCDQERQSALDEARQNPREAIFIPDCGPGGLYKPVQCHQSTGYCWCVLVDTGRPIPGTSTR